MKLRAKTAIAVLLTALAQPANAATPISDAEPPIVKVRTRYGVIKQQLFVFAASDVKLSTANISRRFDAWRNVQAVPTSPVNVLIDCPANAGGGISSYDCSAVPDPKISAETLEIARKLFGLFARELPTLPASTKQIARVARFPFQVDPATRPSVDTSTGKMVPLATMPLIGKSNMPWVEYPLAALNNHAQGNLTSECQVQIDRSIICDKLTFDPPENLKYFENMPLARGLYFHAPEKLTTGESSIGVRFRIVHIFKLSD